MVPDLCPHVVDASGVGIVVKLWGVQILWRESPSAEVPWYIIILKVKYPVLVPDERKGFLLFESDYLKNDGGKEGASGSPVKCQGLPRV